MSLVRKVDGGWQGIATGRLYSPPRECRESAEAQEQQYAKTLTLRIPDDIEVGSPEWIHCQIQEEALSNVQRAKVAETSLAYAAFCAGHPELQDNDYNAEQFCEYFALKGVPIVEFNGANIPLATTPEMWQEAYEWKLAMGSLKVNGDTQARLNAQRAAKEAVERGFYQPAKEDDLYTMPLNQLADLARGPK